MLMQSDLLQTWIDFVHGLLIFLILVKWFTLWVSGPFLCVYNHYLHSDWKEWLEIQMFFSCDQAAIWLVQSVRLSVRPSVRPSVCLSVCHTFFTMFPSSFHHEIFRSYYHGQKWCPCKRSRSEVKGQGHRGQHPTQPFPDSNSSLNSHMAMKSCTQLEAA